MNFIKNKIFEIKDGYKMFSRQYRIDPIDYPKTIIKYNNILVRRKRMLEEKKVARLVKAIENFNRLVEEINY